MWIDITQQLPDDGQRILAFVPNNIVYLPGLMETERQVTTLYDGREWRIHYWLLKVSEIQSRRDAGPKYAPDDMEPSVYDEIPDDIWSREN